MMRNLGISLLLLGLLAAGIDGFRVRERTRNTPSSDVSTAPDDGQVHMAEGISNIPPK